MKRYLTQALVFLLLIPGACSRWLPAPAFPAAIPGHLSSPQRLVVNGHTLSLYFEEQGNGYTVLGIHPLLGRQFLLQVRAGQLIREEFGGLLSSRDVKPALLSVFKK